MDAKVHEKTWTCLAPKNKIAQKLPDDLEEKIVSFHKLVLNLRKEHQFDLNQIGNMDETPLCFDSPPNRTIESKGNKAILIRTTSHERAHFTVVLACVANGTKLKPMVIFKSKAIPEREKMPPGVLVHCQSKGWMDEDGIMLWLHKVWDTRPGALLKKKSLLVWDQFRAHKTNKVKEKLKDINAKQAVIPGGLTSILQPLDVVLNKPFKDRLQKKWIAWMSSDNKASYQRW